MFYYSSIEVKLMGRFNEKFIDINDEYELLSYDFEVVTLEDFENGEIKGVEYGGKRFFVYEYEKDFCLDAYFITNLECTEEELEQWKYERLSKDEQNFLNSLEEGDVITFSAKIPVCSYYGTLMMNYNEASVWDFKRYEDKYASDEIELLIQELKYDGG